MKCSPSATPITTPDQRRSGPPISTASPPSSATRYGHSLDDLSYARHIIPQNSYCLQCDYGNSDFDIRQSFSMFLTYALPQPAKYKLLLGGWQLNTLFSFFTGTPFTVFSGIDSSGTGEYNDRAEVVGNPFANVPASNRATSTYYYFNPAAFAVPAQGTYSNEGAKRSFTVLALTRSTSRCLRISRSPSTPGFSFGLKFSTSSIL